MLDTTTSICAYDAMASHIWREFFTLERQQRGLTGDLLYPLARRSTTHFANFTDKLLNTYYYFFNSFLLYKQVTALQSATIKHIVGVAVLSFVHPILWMYCRPTIAAIVLHGQLCGNYESHCEGHGRRTACTVQPFCGARPTQPSTLRKTAR